MQPACGCNLGAVIFFDPAVRDRLSQIGATLKSKLRDRKSDILVLEKLRLSIGFYSVD